MKSTEEEDHATHFLNVDLDICSRESLEPLVAAFGKRVFVHYVGREGSMYGAHLSLPSYGQGAERLTRDLCSLVERLPAGARRLWNRARRREFNVGVQAGHEPYSHLVQLSERTLVRVARAKGSVVFTTYAAEGAAGPRRRYPRRSIGRKK